MSWARYKVAITKYKDEEQTSSCLHGQNNMWTPAVDFSTFIADDESIVNEDLVAWVTTGFLHIPHAEDIPNTVTVGNGGGVILRPHNYFDNDPSVESPDAVYIHPDSTEECENNKMACLARDTCGHDLPPFTYNGFDGVMSRTTPACNSSHLHNALKRKHDNSSLVFADLTAGEYQQVRDYMWNQPDLHISHDAFAKPTENFIFMIDLRLPKKDDVLRFLDKGAVIPERSATVVVFHGSRAEIKEYSVGPLPNPKYHKDITQWKYGKDLPINDRTVTIGEYGLLFQFLHTEIFKKLSKILKESFGVQKDRSLNPFEGMPRGIQAGDRQTWVSYFRDMSGMYIHPVGFEVLVNHRSTNASQWRVEKLLYNGQYFESAEELIEKYNGGRINKIVYRKIANYASLKPKVKPTGFGPQQLYLQGKRFSVQNNQVLYLDWSFAFGLSSSTGMRVFDIRFKGERIAYELSVQEAMSVYGSITPGVMLTKFLDSSIGIGRFAHELTRGVDCPYTAVFLDTVRYIDINESKTFRNSICIFEHDTGRPLRRHFSDFFSNSYGGVANSVLVFRTITAIGNYDYIWDFIFYQSGSVEAKVHATGYISSSYKISGSLKYGHQVAENTIGNIHTHFINFKVDLDILGVENVFQTKDMKFVEEELPWLPGKKAFVPHLVEEQLETEEDAALRYGKKIPRYLHIASNQTNRWGHQRSYRLQVVSFTGDHLPDAAPEEKSMSWARYKVAITKYKDEEQTSSCLHGQNNMWTPAVDFSTFIADDESIVNEDLVAWVTTGFLHIPHAEDIPNTVTVGNGGGVILRPHNYFDNDPSVESPDAVYIHPDSTEECENNKMACLARDTCGHDLPPFTYNGFDGVMVFQ
ncbi:hypothetical protein SKAU_G00298550 [Synaphobranchus kaupii]|uniref:Amine oxidase n=1 Tax=Synaphobranchus kaupii TaxID=118154 RepID=A0A9Q1EVC1_SYNKA|nr:hypothetical protein SKAU_G00298550 [Synaphobranchus kaupii]